MRRKLWLLIAVVLFGLAAFLMWRGEKYVEAPKLEERVQFPRALRSQEFKRMQTRQTLPEAPANPKEPPPPAVRDPVLAALPRGGKSVVVVEANAIRNSGIGELLLDCFRAQRGEEGLSQLKEQTGVDLLQDLDRVAVSEGALVMSGQFGQAKWDQLKRFATPSAYGQASTLYEGKAGTARVLPDGGVLTREPPTIGVWKDQLVVTGKLEEVKRALDQVEGRGGDGPPPLQDSQTYGEIYGVLSASELAGLLPTEQAHFANQLQEAAKSIELHVDASDGVGIVADVRGPNADSVEDLGKSLGAALSVARLKLQAEGEDSAAEFLDLARVRPGKDGRFSLELALPMAMLQKQLAWCRDRPGARDGGEP